MEPGLTPTSIFFITVLLAGLITDTVLESLFATYIVSPNP